MDWKKLNKTLDEKSDRIAIYFCLLVALCVHIGLFLYLVLQIILFKALVYLFPADQHIKKQTKSHAQLGYFFPENQEFQDQYTQSQLNYFSPLFRENQHIKLQTKYQTQIEIESRRKKLKALENPCPYCKFNLRSGKDGCDECGKIFGA